RVGGSRVRGAVAGPVRRRQCARVVRSRAGRRSGNDHPVRASAAAGTRGIPDGPHGAPRVTRRNAPRNRRRTGGGIRGGLALNGSGERGAGSGTSRCSGGNRSLLPAPVVTAAPPASVFQAG